MSQSLSGSLEELVLTGLVWNTELAAAIALQVTPELFTTRHFRTIAKAAIDYTVRYADAPKNHLPDILESELNKGETSAVLWKTIGRLEEIQPHIKKDYVINELDKFVKLHNMRLAINSASEFIVKGDPEKAEEALHKIQETRKMQPGTWMHDPDQVLKFLDRDEENDDFTLGIDALDVRGIRPARKELLVIMAPKKRGKSMALISIGKNASLINRKNVLHITLEMSEVQTAKRYVQAICGWTSGEVDEKEKTISVPMFKRDTHNNFMGMEFDNIKPMAIGSKTRKEAADKLKSTFRGKRRLLIKEYPTGALTTAQLTMYLEYLKRTENFEPDLLIVDYANLMHMNAANVRTETGRIFRELRGIAVMRNLAVVTATQTNRASENSKIVGATHVAEDWSIMGTADIALSICQTPEEKEKRLARILVAAARNVPDGYLVLVSQVFETCQFATDSTYMSKVYQRDFDRMTGQEDD